MQVLRDWDRRSKNKSDDSGDSYHGPVLSSDFFRCTTAPLPSMRVQSLPVLPGSKIDLWASCRDETQKIVEAAGLDWKMINVIGRADVTRPQPWVSLVVLVSSTERKQDWQGVVISIHKMLHALDCLELSVEIQAEGPHHEAPSRIYPIEPTHELVKVWSTILRDPIIRVLDREDWQSLNAFRYGANASAEPVIIVTTTDMSSSHWSGIIKEIEAICVSHGVPKLKATVIEGTLTGAFNDPTPTLGHQQCVYNPRVNLGHSIGINPKGGGTLGGYIRLVDRTTNTDEVMCLTNYHVIRPSDESWPASYDRGGKQPWPNQHTNAHSPAFADNRSEIEELTESIRKEEFNVQQNAHLKATIDANTAKESQRLLWIAITAFKAQ